MQLDEYQKLAEVTESKDFEQIVKRISTIENIRLQHALLGLCSEVGEFADQLKKHIFYGKSLDKINLSEESGDLLWYLALAANVPGMLSMDENSNRNIAKLKARYGEKFSEYAATNRNLAKERAILEGEFKLLPEFDYDNKKIDRSYLFRVSSCEPIKFKQYVKDYGAQQIEERIKREN